jgi:hypothetical protein
MIYTLPTPHATIDMTAEPIASINDNPMVQFSRFIGDVPGPHIWHEFGGRFGSKSVVLTMSVEFVSSAGAAVSPNPSTTTTTADSIRNITTHVA